MKVTLLIGIVSLALAAGPGWAARVRHSRDRRVEALNQQQLDKARGAGAVPAAPLVRATPPILGAPLMEPGMQTGVGAR